MTLHIDPRAIVHPTAKLADGVTIGPFAIIGEEVTIGEETTIAPMQFLNAGQSSEHGVALVRGRYWVVLLSICSTMGAKLPPYW